MEDLSGKQLGKYQVIAPLGEGGMAAVYKAYQPGMDRYVALKILPRHFANDPEFVGRFRQEAQVIANLQHPHILPVHDFGEAESYTYLVMPLVETGTLADLMKGKPLTLQQIRSMISQIGDALDYAHSSRKLIHRDVKPSNVLIDERGNCLLTDFGIAKMVEGTVHFTQTGAIIGTPRYMSPEQGTGESLTPASDIYSLGVVMYEMATGRAPFDAETPMAIVIKHMNDPLPGPRAVNPDIPDRLERVILKALAKAPEDRYSTAGEMVRAVKAAIPETPHVEVEGVTVRPPSRTAVEEARAPVAGEVAPEPPPSMPRPPEPKPQRGLAVGLGAAGVIGVVLCAAAFFGGRAILNSFSSGTATAEGQASATAVSAATGTSAVQQASTATAATARAEEATALAAMVRDATATAEAKAPEPTPTSAPASLQGPGSLAAAQPSDFPSALWPQSMQDGFSSAQNGWSDFHDYQDSYGVRSFSIQGGSFHWEVTPSQDVNLHDTPSMGLIDDFYVSVEAQQVAGPASCDFGIAFRVAADNRFYTFSISETGQYAVQLLLQGQWTTLIDWTASAAIRPGEVNRLGVLAEGDHFIFFINDQAVDQVQDEQIPHGRVGLSIDHFEEGVLAAWEFDDFELREPWAVAYSERFDTNTGAWETGSSTFGDLTEIESVTGGQYRFDVSCTNSQYGCLTSGYLKQQTNTSDFYFTVDAQRIEAPSDAEYGVRFRDDGQNYFDFMIADNGLFSATLWYESEIEFYFFETPTGVILEGGVNRLGVHASGSHFTLFINGVRVGVIEDEHLASGAFGLAVSLHQAGEGVFAFDNFVLRLP